MNNILLFIIIIFLFISIIHSAYNPIPIGSIIISTIDTISVMQPKEYGGTDTSTIIFTATKNMTIVNTIFDSTSRELYILFSNSTNNIIYISQLKSVGNLDTVVYRLPISFNISNLNKLTSFSADIKNKRAFLTNQSGIVTMFSMSGAMEKIISPPTTIVNPIRSVGYNQISDHLFIITDSTVDSCFGLDENHLQCCEALPTVKQLRSITFDPSSSTTYAYVMDERSGIYQVVLDNITSCPITLRPINNIGTYFNIHFAIDRDLYVCSGSHDNSYYNSILIIGKGEEAVRTIVFETSIVALHISYPRTKATEKMEQSCFHGITYHDYRVAVVLAAIFGTVMGIFMCFNALFCIDFFMTKRIIENLKRQIPHNLLEDRWNKLVQEKYAKLALEIHRKKNDPPPKRKSSAGVRKIPTEDNVESSNSNEGHPISNPIPKLSAYLRRKSESYVSRRRSEEYRNQQQSNENRLLSKSNQPTTTTTSTNIPQVHNQGIQEEDHNQKKPQETDSQRDLLKDDGEIF